MTRAQLSMQFNWIFVLVAGISFFIFFIMIARSNIISGQQGDALAIADALESTFKDMRASREAGRLLDDLPHIEIDMLCDGSGTRMIVGESGAEKDLRTLLLFAPERLYDDELAIFTQPLDIPFPVDNLLYLTDLDHEYLFIDDAAGYAQRMHHAMPNISAAHVSGAADVRFGGLPHYTIIAFDRHDNPLNPAAIKPSAGSEVVLIVFEEQPYTGSDLLSSIAKVKFYRGHPDLVLVGESMALTMPMMIGAAMAGSKERYECLLSPALERVATQSSLVLERSEAIGERLRELNSPCAPYYANVENGVRSILDDAQEATLQNALRELATHQRMLDEVQHDLSIMRCPLVY